MVKTKETISASDRFDREVDGGTYDKMIDNINKKFDALKDELNQEFNALHKKVDNACATYDDVSQGILARYRQRKQEIGLECSKTTKAQALSDFLLAVQQEKTTRDLQAYFNLVIKGEGTLDQEEHKQLLQARERIISSAISKGEIMLDNEIGGAVWRNSEIPAFKLKP